MNRQTIDIIVNYLKEKPVERAWIFGSFSRGEERADSDVDIIVRLVPDAKMGLSFFGMMVDLEELLHRPVDIVREGCLLPFASPSAEKDKILIYERTA